MLREWSKFRGVECEEPSEGAAVGILPSLFPDAVAKRELSPSSSKILSEPETRKSNSLVMSS